VYSTTFTKYNIN